MAKMELARQGQGRDPERWKDFRGSAQEVEEGNCPSPEEAAKYSHWQISAHLTLTLGFCLHSVKGRDVGARDA